MASAPQFWGFVLFQDRRRDSFHGVGPHWGEAGSDHQRSVLPHPWVWPGNPAALREKGHGGNKGEPWCCCPLQDTPSPRAASRPSPSSAPATAPSLSSCPGELWAWGALGSLQGGLGLLEQVWGGFGFIAGGFVWVWVCCSRLGYVCPFPVHALRSQTPPIPWNLLFPIRPQTPQIPWGMGLFPRP